MGWRAYIAPDPEDEPEGEIFLFCPECAEREFGPLGWENAHWQHWSGTCGSRDRDQDGEGELA
jgi:hypothetical protein